MSTKFEQLLDLIVNEEMDKANELFHEIVVEKSREIYENLISEEEEELETDEAKEEADESVDEAEEEEADESVDESEEEADESMDLEDSYMMDSDEEDPEAGGLEKTDDFENDIEMDGEEGGEEGAIFDIKNAIKELEDALANLESGGMDSDADMGMGDETDDEDEGMTMGFAEGRRMTREYVEKVGNDWDKNSMKGQGQYVGAGTGDKEGSPQEGRSPIASGKNKPGPAGVGAGNIAQGASESAPDGTSPNGKAGGFLSNPKEDNGGNGNVPGGKMGVKNLSKVAGGHGAEKKGAAPGPVGSGTGDKAGQTSIDPATSKQFLKPYSK